jgi:polyether ionophore transport system ATP-binding protein
MYRACLVSGFYEFDVWSPFVNAIEVCGLRKTFGKTTALDGLDLTVASGEVHGFLGPNGAGKTTTIRILLGLLRADGGTARLLGGDPWREAVGLHRRLAYVPGDVTLWPTLTGGEVIDLLGRLRGGLDAGRRAELLERFDLDPTKKTRAYSKGNRQKVALIAALASDAELLILDEPTSGLDPLMEAVFRECAEQERSRGRTVLLSSHILSEVEALCDRVTIIRAGRTVETGTLAEMRHLTRTSIAAELTGPVPGLADLAGVYDLVVDTSADGGSRVRCEVDSDLLGDLLKLLVAAGVRTLTSQPPTLEELFLRHYTDLPAADLPTASLPGAGEDGPGQAGAGQAAIGQSGAGAQS